MSFRLAIAVAVAAVVAAPAAGAPRVLMPGVTYERNVQFTTRGPVAVHVLRAPRPVGLYALKPVLSNDLIVGDERVSAMQRRVAGGATVAGVNGAAASAGMLMRSGVLDFAPQAERSSAGINGDGTLRVARVAFAGTWQGRGQRRPLVLNRPPGGNGVALYTSTYGLMTPAAAETVEVVLAPFSPAAPNRELIGSVAQMKQGGGTPIPRNGAVLVGRGAGGAGRLAEETALGMTVTVRLVLTPDWSGMADAIGPGPVLVRDGRPIFRANELFTIDHLASRRGRTAVGQLADGRIVLVAVDGRERGYSVGMTNFDLALTMSRLGAVNAIALDTGAPATVAFDGAPLNGARRWREPSVDVSLNVFYYGVYAFPPAPVSGGQALAYRVARPSNAVARLIAPNGAERVLDAGFRTPGIYRFSWGASGEPSGTWRFVVEATDDLGRPSRAERSFTQG